MALAGKPTVLILNSYGMHYRTGIFEAMLQSQRFVYSFGIGVPPVGSTQATIRGIGEEIDYVAARSCRVAGIWWQGGLLTLARKVDPDILVVDPFYRNMTVWVITAMRRLRGKPVVFWGLGWVRTHRPWKERVRSFLFSQCDLFLTYGDGSRSRAIKMGFDKDRVFAVGNSLADSDAARGASLLPPKETSVYCVGASGRLQARKRFELLIDAARRLRELGMETQIVLVGGGPARPELEALAKRAGVRVEFLGELYDESSLAEFYRTIHVTVIPGDTGLSAIQSLMHGRPVLTHDNRSRHGAEVEAIRCGETGAFFEEGNVESLVEKLLYVREEISADRQGVREACRKEYLYRWSPSAQLERMEEGMSRMSRVAHECE